MIFYFVYDILLNYDIRSLLTLSIEQVQPDTVVSMVDSSDHWGTLTAPTGAKDNDLLRGWSFLPSETFHIMPRQARDEPYWIHSRGKCYLK